MSVPGVESPPGGSLGEAETAGPGPPGSYAAPRLHLAILADLFDSRKAPHPGAIARHHDRLGRAVKDKLVDEPEDPATLATARFGDEVLVVGRLRPPGKRKPNGSPGANRRQKNQISEILDAVHEELANWESCAVAGLFSTMERVTTCDEAYAPELLAVFERLRQRVVVAVPPDNLLLDESLHELFPERPWVTIRLADDPRPERVEVALYGRADAEAGSGNRSVFDPSGFLDACIEAAGHLRQARESFAGMDAYALRHIRKAGGRRT